MGKTIFLEADRRPFASFTYHNKIKKKFNDVFCYGLDPMEEEIDLIENCRSKQYKLTVRLVNFFMRLATIKLGPGQDESNESLEEITFSRPILEKRTPSNYFHLRDPFEALRANSNSIKLIFNESLCPILAWLFSIYVCTKFTILGILQFENDLIVQKMGSKVRNSSSSSQPNFCCLTHEIYETNEDKRMLFRLKDVRSWLEALGDPFSAANGISTAVFLFAGSLPITVFLLSCMNIQNKRLRVDLLSFLFDPLSERLRIKTELCSLIFRTNESVKNYQARIELDMKSAKKNQKKSYSNKKSPTSNDRLRFSNHRKWPSTMNIFPSNFTTIDDRRIYSDVNLNIKYKTGEYRSYTSVLFDANLVEMVRPVHLTSRWHRTLIKIEMYKLETILFLGQIINIILFISAFSIELRARLNQRLATLECLRWRPDAILVAEAFNLRPLTDPGDSKLYSSYDGSTTKYLQLIIIEIKYYLTEPASLSLAELLVALYLFLYIAGFFYYLYLSCFLSRLVWLNQIDSQINWITHQLKLIRSYRIDSTDDICQEDGGEREVFQTSSEELIKEYISENGELRYSIQISMKAILVTYLNYELFRKQQVHYRTYATSSITQLLTIAIASFAIYYIVIKNLNNFTHPSLTILVATPLFFVNIHFLVSAIMIKKNTRLTKSIIEMLAIGAASGMQLVDLFDLWRRQLLDEEGTKDDFAVKLFGFYLSYEAIITFNAYVALYVFVLEP